MYIDTHSHINFNHFKNDAHDVIKRSLAEQTWQIVVGSDYKTSKRALDYANRYEKGVYATVGLHPIHIFPHKEDDYETLGEDYNYDVYEKLAKFEKVVAIGEVGLDYYHTNPAIDQREVKETQKKVLYQQLLLARKLDLPAIIHCRQAHDDMVPFLSDFKRENRELIPKEKPWAVMHCFSGNEDLAWKYFGLGVIISFTGLITFSKQWDDLIRKIPNDKYMIETDCPYMTPEPFRGERNEPMLVKYVSQRIAEIKNMNHEKIQEISTSNARNFFKI